MKNNISRAQKISNLVKAGVVLSVALNSELLAANEAETKCTMGRMPIKNEQTPPKPPKPKNQGKAQGLEAFKGRLLKNLLAQRILIGKIETSRNQTMGLTYDADRDENVLKGKLEKAQLEFYAILDELKASQKDAAIKAAIEKIEKLSKEIDNFEEDGIIYDRSIDKSIILKLQDERLVLIENLGK